MWRFISLFFLIGLVLNSCGSRPEIVKLDPAYAKYVSAFSYGMISRNENIRVVLHPDRMKNIDRDSDALNEMLFTFEPSVKGHVVWTEENVVEFVPDEPLDNSQFYNVFFDLNKVSNVEREHHTFHFQVATYPLTISIENLTLEDYYYDLENYELSAYISVNEEIDTALLRSVITVTQDGALLPFDLVKYEWSEQYYLNVHDVKRKKASSEIRVSWNAAPLGSISSGSVVEKIPAIGDFTLLSAEVEEDEDQFVRLNFSEPISSTQDLNGLIELKGEKFTASVDGTTVDLYFDHRITGERKLKVHAGLRNARDHKMNQGDERTLTFEAPKPNVRIRGNGNILPNSQGLIFPFETIGLKSVEVRILKILETNVHYFLQTNDFDGDEELTRFGKVLTRKTIKLNQFGKIDPKVWTQHVLNLENFIQTEPGAIYRVSIKFSRKDSDCGCPTEGNAESKYEDESWTENNWHTWGDFDDGFDSWYGYYGSSRQSPCDDDYYSGKARSRNIIASDLGLIYKLDQRKRGHVFVNNMLNTEPMPGATVEFYTYARDLITSGVTDQNGMLELPLREKPFLMVAKFGKQRGYLKLTDGKTNSLSKFDVEGERNPDGISGYLYGERGVWRPGDSLYISFMLGDRYHKLPKDFPVKFELSDPYGQTVYSVTKTKNVNNLYDFRCKTDSDGMTGDYTATATVGDETFYKSFKVEAIRPNRLKINFRTPVSNDKDSSSFLQVAWLHGAVAKNLKASIDVSFRPAKTTFSQHKGYIFDSPVRSYSSDALTVYEGETNELGIALPKLRMPETEEASGKLTANYVVRVFEQSGDFSTDRFQTTFSPYPTYIGLKAPFMKDYDQSLQTDKNHRFEVVSVDAAGNLKNTAKLNVRIYKLKWHWWYEKNEFDDVYEYTRKNESSLVKDTTIMTVNGKSSFTFKAKHNEYGRYLFTVTDVQGKHQTGQIIYLDWPYWERGSRIDKEEAKMMNFSCDKNSYVCGEKVQVRFPSPQAGRALVSIENGVKVIQKNWVNTVAGETTYEFTATKEMAPAAYIHITLIQPHAQTVNDLPIRLYGIIPIVVDDPETHLHPLIQAEEVFKPESTETIKVSEKNGRRMTYTLAVVDEGLLDITRFKTPAPWSTFYPREALGIMTWDLYDDVIGAYSGKLNNLFGIGGDGGDEEMDGQKANRFPPMVRFVGPFTVEAGQTRSHKIDIPNYIGSARIMVVAHDNEGAYGEAEKTAFVRKPLMVLTTLPRMLGPVETVHVPITVFALENHVRNVQISVEGNEFFKFTNGKTQNVTFKDNGDQVVYFPVEIDRRCGLGKITVKATSGKETAYETIEIQVRPSNPLLVETTTQTVEAGEKLQLPIKLLGMGGSNKVSVEVSKIPAIALEKRLSYLINYPHGCLEQTTSGAFPQLYLKQLTTLTEEQKNTVNQNILAALKRLTKFQTSDGGFAYWPGENEANEWATTYAGHFLLEAEKIGFQLPSGMKENWKNYQKKKAEAWSPGAFRGRSESDYLNQVYRLFTLALNGTPELGAMNRMREGESLNAVTTWELAAAYSLAGKKDIALKLVTNMKFLVDEYREFSGTFGSGLRDKSLMLLAADIMGKHNETIDAVVREVAQELRSEKALNTQETAYSLMAMASISDKESGGGAFDLRLENEEWTSKKIEKAIMRFVWTGKKLAENKNVQIANKSGQKLYVTYTTQGTPLEAKSAAKSKGLKMGVEFLSMNDKPIKVDKTQRGMEIKIVLTLKNISQRQTYREMALNFVVPTGWELSNGRLDQTESANSVRYTDFRDDRANMYMDLNPGEEKRITLYAITACKGRFYLPSVFANAMYNEQIMAFQPGRWIEVD